MKRLLQNRDVVLVLALVMGLLVPHATRWSEGLVLPCLAIMVTLACTGIPTSIFHQPRTLIRPFLLGIGLTFPLLGGVVLILTALLIEDPLMTKGFYIIAVTPPGVAIVPFTYHLRGNIALSIAGVTGGYLAALVVTPLAGLALLGGSIVDPGKLLLIVVELIVIPLVLSRIALTTFIADRLEPLRGTIINWAFFVAIYTIVGLNRAVFFEQPLSLIPIAGIVVASSFVLGFVVEKFANLLNASAETTTSVVLLATVKNYGLAAGLALTLFEKKAAVPAAVATVILIIYLVWLGLRDKKSVQ